MTANHIIWLRGFKQTPEFYNSGFHKKEQVTVTCNQMREQKYSSGCVLSIVQKKILTDPKTNHFPVTCCFCKKKKKKKKVSTERGQ